MSEFKEGDTVTKANSNPTDQIQDGESGIVMSVRNGFTSVMFTGRASDVLVPDDKLEMMYPLTGITPPPTAAEVRASLSADELAALETVADMIGVHSTIKAELERKGLICNQWQQLGRITSFITDHGRAVLAASPVTVAAVGEAKPATITAREFVEEGYEGKVTRGECVVKNPYNDCAINKIWPPYEGKGAYVFSYANRGPGGTPNPEFKLSVTWLTTSTAAEKPAASEATPTAEWRLDKDLFNEIKVLLAKNQIVYAIKAIRTKYSEVGLFEAKVYCESIQAGRDFPLKSAIEERDTTIAELRAALSAAEATADGYRAFAVKVMNVTRTGGEWKGYNGDTVLVGLSLEAESLINPPQEAS